MSRYVSPLSSAPLTFVPRQLADEPKRLLPYPGARPEAQHAATAVPPEALLLTVEQAAQLAQVSEFYLRRAIAESGLLSVKLPTVGQRGRDGRGRTRPVIRIARVDFEQWLNRFRRDARTDVPPPESR